MPGEDRSSEPTGAVVSDDGVTAPVMTAVLSMLPTTGATEVEGPSRTSIWSFVLSTGAFLVLLSPSPLQDATFSEGMIRAAHATTAVTGGVVTLGSLVAMGFEPSHSPAFREDEAWPFAGIDNDRVGMWIFPVSDVVLFGSFIETYVFTHVAFDWTGWESIPSDPIPGLVNTYILLTGNFTVVLVLVAAEKRHEWDLVASFGTTFILGIGFLVNKGLEWQYLFHEGLWLSTNVRASTPLLTTGLHAAHVIAGLAVALYLTTCAWRGAHLEDSRSTEHFGLYWHFVDVT